MPSRDPVCRRRGVRRRSLSQRSQVTAGSQDKAALAVLPLHLWGLELTWASVATALQPGVLGSARLGHGTRATWRSRRPAWTRCREDKGQAARTPDGQAPRARRPPCADGGALLRGLPLPHLPFVLPVSFRNLECGAGRPAYPSSAHFRNLERLRTVHWEWVVQCA